MWSETDPFGTIYSEPRLIIITSVPLGNLMSARRSPFVIISSVTVMSFNEELISSGSSTPKSLPVFSIGRSRCNLRARVAMVEP